MTYGRQFDTEEPYKRARSARESDAARLSCPSAFRAGRAVLHFANEWRSRRAERSAQGRAIGDRASGREPRAFCSGPREDDDKAA